jgi:hypothetical protein
MDKDLARRNMRMGIVLTLVLLMMFGITFLWVTIYLHTV